MLKKIVFRKLLPVVAGLALLSGCVVESQAPGPEAPPPPEAQVVPPQYRTVQETVMVSRGGVIAHRTPAQYRTVMVPRTVMVAPEGVQYEHIPAQYGTREHVEMVAPARTYYVPVPPRCNSCGY